MIPEEQREPTLAALNWRDEPRMYRSGVGDQLPGDLRMPRVHGVDESTNRIRIWMEEVVDTQPWDPTRYHRTAMALGRLGGAWSAPHAVEAFGLGHRSVGDLFFGKIVNFDLPMQADDHFWQDPAVADAVDDRYRRDLFDLAERMPAMIARLDDLPRGVCHGDATPHNFSSPAMERSWPSTGRTATSTLLASDLGQLLAKSRPMTNVPVARPPEDRRHGGVIRAAASTTWAPKRLARLPRQPLDRAADADRGDERRRAPTAPAR